MRHQTIPHAAPRRQFSAPAPAQPSLFDVAPRHAQPTRPRPLSEVARSTGLEASRPHIGRQAARVLQFLASAGPMTDHAIADALGLPLASINSTRHMLVKRRLVMAVDHALGVGSARRTRWGLAIEIAERS